MTTQVSVYCNRNQNRFRQQIEQGKAYQPDDSDLVHAITFNIPDDDPDDYSICERTYLMLNSDGNPGMVYGTLTEEVCIAYHQQFPSLSVGDVVMVFHLGSWRCQAYMVDAVGFKHLRD